MNDYSLFEFGNNMLTKDNYTIIVNGSLTVKENENESELISKIEIILREFISENLLEKVLLIVEKKTILMTYQEWRKYLHHLIILKLVR